jgi:transcriptional regulator with XRE-family HTH domain
MGVPAVREKRLRFAERRKALGLSQENLAEALEVETSTVARWERGETTPVPWHRPRLAKAFKVSVEEVAEMLNGNGAPAARHSIDPDDRPRDHVDEAAEELRGRLLNAAAVDERTVALLAAQADTIREVDRRLGARAAAQQMQGHLAALDLLRSFTVAAGQRELLADLYADAAALAGWQCLDLGDLRASWRHYEAARSAGREGRSPTALVHAMAEQAYVLAELDEMTSAVELAEYARSIAGTAVPPLLLSWLWAVQGELYAASGDAGACRRAFERAERFLPAEAHNPELPYIALNDVHLARWRGSAFARLGEAVAIEELRRALAGLDTSFSRARAGLHVDLAHALVAADRRTEAAEQLREARVLAIRVGSARQRRRIRRVEAILNGA